MKKFFLVYVLSFLAIGFQNIFAENEVNGPEPIKKSKVSFWLTSPSANIYFQSQQISDFSVTKNLFPTINIDPSVTYQSMEGFGFCLTGGSATLIHQMGKSQREALLKELFATDAANIGTSYLRISIGASDLSDHVFTYDDLPGTETDPELKKFTIDEERKDLIPVLKEILAINPQIKILGSPWTAPVWMKTNGDTRGGSLKPEYYGAYANYFVKYIHAMAKEGIQIDAITIQNEPLHPGNNPSMYMTAEDQALFVKNHLGPVFSKENIKTKIIVYDHNADKPDYPLTIYKDPEAAKYVDGAAFHLYAGSIEALSEVHKSFPDKHLYFTEQWVGAPGNMAGDIAWHVKTLIIGGARNWCRTVLEWNLAADPNNDPHTDRGGCSQCLGAVTIDKNLVKRNPAYYIIAHASKFVRPGSVRINSDMVAGLPNVTYQTPDKKIVMIVYNENAYNQTFNIQYKGKVLTVSLEKGAVGTFIF